MTTHAIALPRMRKIPRPPKALAWKAIHCLCWGIWTVLCVMATVIEHHYWEVVLVLLYGKWMARDYRELIKMIEAWLDERPVKLKSYEPVLVIWTVICAPIVTASYVH